MRFRSRARSNPRPDRADVSPQNGYDNSAPRVKGRVMWDQVASYQARSVAVIEAMAARYGGNPALLGFGLLNEPIVSAADLMPPPPDLDPP